VLSVRFANPRRLTHGRNDLERRRTLLSSGSSRRNADPLMELLFLFSALEAAEGW
jgi:hypothetical protein